MRAKSKPINNAEIHLLVLAECRSEPKTNQLKLLEVEQDSPPSIVSLMGIEKINRTFALRETMIALGDERFWLEDPKALWLHWGILPNCQMTDAQRLNALTRLIILISLIMLLFGLCRWYLFLLLGLGLVIILWYTTRPKPIIENYCQGSYCSEDIKPKIRFRSRR